MSKTYIFGPVDVPFDVNPSANCLDAGLEVSNYDPKNTKITVGDLTCIYAKDATPIEQGYQYSEDGTIDSHTAVYINAYYGDASEGGFEVFSEEMFAKGAATYTVSIYTGEDDPEPSGGSISKNFSFVDHSRNDLNGIAEIVAPFENEEEDTTPETIANLSKNVTYELHPHNDVDHIRFGMKKDESGGGDDDEKPVTSSLLIINGTYDGESISTDKTPNDVYEAFGYGIPVYLSIDILDQSYDSFFAPVYKISYSPSTLKYQIFCSYNADDDYVIPNLLANDENSTFEYADVS